MPQSWYWENNMKFFPYEKVLLASSLSEDEIVLRLKQVIEPEDEEDRERSFPDHPKSFIGELDGLSFKIYRRTKYGKASSLRARGEIIRSKNGMFVQVILRWHVVSEIVSALFISISGLALFLGIVAIVKEQRFDPGSIVFLFVFGAFFGFSLTGFNSESKRIKQLLLSVLQARSVKFTNKKSREFLRGIHIE